MDKDTFRKIGIAALVVGLILGIFFMLQYKTIDADKLAKSIEYPYTHSASDAYTPNILLGLAVLGVFSFFGVICFGISAILENMDIAAAQSEEAKKRSASFYDDLVSRTSRVAPSAEAAQIAPAKVAVVAAAEKAASTAPSPGAKSSVTYETSLERFLRHASNSLNAAEVLALWDDYNIVSSETTRAVHAELEKLKQSEGLHGVDKDALQRILRKLTV